MALTHGARLGPYEIDALIGAGGMGDVYRATDTRLRRTVAIKTISDQLRDRKDLRERFRIEAEAIAALGHPHICQIHDIGEQDGLDFLVMEYLEGESLSARLARGALPLEQALEVAIAIAGALDAAHRRGIVHRDLKPANVMLTRTGVKLLDFGLARWRGTDGGAPIPGSTLAPTSAPLTEAGAHLGTWPYMAPEQIRGQPADARSDIFAFGAVLYEMIAGRRPFDGPNHHALVTAILEQEPPSIDDARPSCPPALERLVRLCLAKDPDTRWQSAGDVRRALETISVAPEHHSVEATGPSLAGRARVRRRAAWLAVATLGLFAVAGVAWLVSRPQAPQSPARVLRSTIMVDAESVATSFGAVAFAPDGQSIVYTGRAGGRRQLYRRLLRETRGTPIAGSEDSAAPFFSPDGQWVGFFNISKQNLMKVPAAGGPPAIICDIQSSYGASWGEDDTIVVALRPDSGLWLVSAAGGFPQPITTLAAEDEGNDHRWPQVLPGGRAVLFTVGTGPADDARIVVQDLRTGTRKDLVRGSASARYVPTGYLVYARNAELLAMPFDVARLEVTGPAVHIAEGVAEDTEGAPEYDFSATGDLAYVPGLSGGRRHRLAFVDLQGGIEPIDVPPGLFALPRVSRDGRLVAVMMGGAKNNVWIYDIGRGTSTRVTFGRYHNPVWAPDGRVTVGRGGPGRTQVVLRAADGSGADETLTEAGHGDLPGTWSPDGRTLVFERRHPDGQSDLWALTPGAESAPLLISRYNEANARYSPDGRLLAYTSDETGRSEIYVRTMSGELRRAQVSTGGASVSVWSPDGRRLYYRGTGGPASTGIWVVDVAAPPTLEVSKPRLLFPNPGFGGYFDIMPDGRRFVMIQQDDTPPPSQLNLVLNWFRQPAPAESR